MGKHAVFLQNLEVNHHLHIFAECKALKTLFDFLECGVATNIKVLPAVEIEDGFQCLHALRGQGTVRLGHEVTGLRYRLVNTTHQIVKLAYLGRRVLPPTPTLLPAS